MSNLKSERSICSPNVNSLMKISLGLILFTIVSTALVYAEDETENNLMIHISENAFLYASAQYFDNSMISTNPGESIIIINDEPGKLSKNILSAIKKKDKRIKIINNTKNIGTGISWNKVMNVGKRKNIT